MRTSIYLSLVTVTVAPKSSKNIGPMMPLAEIAAHTMLLGECRDVVATSLSLEVPKKTFVFELTYSSRLKWASSEVHRRLRNSAVSSIFSSILTAIAYLFSFGGCKALPRLYYV